MNSLEDFADITRREEPLAPYVWMKVGGPAEALVEPRDPDELQKVIRCCHEQGIPIGLLGGGSNLLVRDEGVRGVVLRITGPAFSEITIDGTTVRAGAGALLSHLISRSIQASLAGLETLAGIPGTVGGALHGNAGGQNGDIGQFVRKVTVLTATGEKFTRSEDELSFGYRDSSIDELAILEAEFQLRPDNPEELTKRLRKTWISKKASQPLAHQSAGCIFKNPRGLSAGRLIEQAGLKGMQAGQAEISDRHANFIVTHQGATAGDVLELMELARAKVLEAFGVDLEPEIEIW